MELDIGEKENKSMKKRITKITNQKENESKKLKKQKTVQVVKDRSYAYSSSKSGNKITDKYSDEDLGKIKIVKDFLPTPDELALKDSTVKVTLNLSRTSVEFFKALALKNGSQYQKVIRNLLDSYTTNYIRL